MNTKYVLTSGKAGIYLCLIIGMVLLGFSGSMWHSEWATWLYPIFLLRFLTLQKGGWRLALFFALFYVSIKMAYAGAVPVQGLMGMLVILLITFFAAAPYFIHKLGFRPGVFWTTLVFPSALVATEFAMSFGPYGTWGSIANALYGNKILLQVASITGQSGITFVVGWSASVVNWLWANGFPKRCFYRIKVYIICMAAVFVFGMIRYCVPQKNRVSLAGIAVRMSWGDFDLNGLAKDTLSPQCEVQRLELLRLGDTVLNMAAEEAGKGARIVVGAEGNVLLLKRDEPGFLVKAMQLAKQRNMYLFLGLGIPVPGKSPFSVENKVVVLSPDGGLVCQYYKSKPVPGEPCIKGNGRMPVIESPYGRLSTVICYDADFPRLVRQAGENKIDLLIIPANDWREISPFHTQMALMRGIENGVSVIREATHGLAAIADAGGRVVARKDYFEKGDLIMEAELPRQRKWALYPMLGDFFAIICCIAVPLLVLISIFVWPRKNQRK